MPEEEKDQKAMSYDDDGGGRLKRHKTKRQEEMLILPCVANRFSTAADCPWDFIR